MTDVNPVSLASINELCKVGSQAAWGPTESRSLLYNTEQMCTVVYTVLSHLNVYYFVHRNIFSFSSLSHLPLSLQDLEPLQLVTGETLASRLSSARQPTKLMTNQNI